MLPLINTTLAGYVLAGQNIRHESKSAESFTDQNLTQTLTAVCCWFNVVPGNDASSEARLWTLPIVTCWAVTTMHTVTINQVCYVC